MRLLLVGLVVGVIGISTSARADCVPSPSSCYCGNAVAVVDGHVEAIGETIDVRIDVLTRDGADDLPSLAEGDLITLQDVYQTDILVGDRVLLGLDDGAALVRGILPVSTNETVRCSESMGHEASVGEASGWMLAEAGECRAALEEKGWMKPCDDTVESCGVATAPDAAPATGWAALVLAAAIGWARRRRFHCKPL